MKKKEAYSTLEIPETSSVDEAKKAFRQLSKKFHPDNKDTGSEDKFKKINEAYQAISNNKFDDNIRQPQGWGGGNPFRQQQTFHATNIETSVTVSFKDSVLGCKKELKFNRKTKCKDCNGNGEVALHNGCDKCGGKGQVVSRQGYSVMIQTCDKCYGRTKSDPCDACGTQGVLDAEATITVSVPGGIQNGNILRLGGMGNYVGSFGPMEQHTDVFLHLTVTPEPGLELVGGDVVSNLQISLLEALKGSRKTVKTILGDREVVIKPKSRNREEVIIPHVGVNRQGNQRVILDVQYPENIDKLVESLSEEGKS